MSEPSSSLQFQVEALPFSLQTLVDCLEGSPDPPEPRPSLQSWGFSTFISILVIFYSVIFLASIKIVTVFILLYNYRRLYFKPKCLFILSCIFVLAFCRRLLKIRRNSQPQFWTWKKDILQKICLGEFLKKRVEKVTGFIFQSLPHCKMQSKSACQIIKCLDLFSA